MTTDPFVRLLLSVATVISATASMASAQTLSLGSPKHWAATVTAKSGIGTADARVEARSTRRNFQDWCDNWRSEDKKCVEDLLASEEAKTTYRASADCVAGRITAVDGHTYLLAGTWPAGTDIGAGRTRWRDASGSIVERDNASDGLGISGQWEVLCPGPIRKAPAASAVVPAPPPPSAPQRSAASLTQPALLVCGGQPFCTESLSFAATVSDFQAILQNGNTKILTARISFRNKLTRPLTLGFVAGSGIATDDRGNRYVVSGERAVQGIGLVQGMSADAKFTLEPGESSDARWEFVWNASGREIFGLAFNIDLAIREIDTIAGNQLRLGREHALHFSKLGNRETSQEPRATVAPPTPSGVAGAVPVAAAPATPKVDVCAGRRNCFGAGPFVAEVTGLTASQPGGPAGGWRTVQANVRFWNLTTQPIILGYLTRSGVITDNQGNRYTVRASWDGVKGIGAVDQSKADTQFVLNGGAPGNATFTMSWSADRRDPVGTAFNFDFSVAHLEVLPGQQVHTVREYTIAFAGLSTSSAAVPAPSKAGSTSEAAATAPADGCSRKPRCYSEGPITVEVAGLTASQPGGAAGGWRSLQANLRFQNLSTEPVILGYVARSAVITDNSGNRYTIRAQWDGVKGIGTVDQSTADTQFVLNAGASRTATFTLSWPQARTDSVGTTFNFDAAVAHLEITPGRQVRTVREYAVSIPNLTATGPGLLNKLLQGIPKRE